MKPRRGKTHSIVCCETLSTKVFVLLIYIVLMNFKQQNKDLLQQHGRHRLASAYHCTQFHILFIETTKNNSKKNKQASQMNYQKVDLSRLKASLQGFTSPFLSHMHHKYIYVFTYKIVYIYIYQHTP